MVFFSFLGLYDGFYLSDGVRVEKRKYDWMREREGRLPLSAMNLPSGFICTYLPSYYSPLTHTSPPTQMIPKFNSKEETNHSDVNHRSKT